MELESLHCNNCGSPLEVPETANYVKCNHCSSQLAIRRTASTTTTQKLNEIELNQQALTERLRQLERDNRVAQIDREWEREKRRYLYIDRQGHEREPSLNLGLSISCIMGSVGVFFMVFGFVAEIGALFAGVVLIAGGTHVAWLIRQRHKDFREARKRYLRRRKEALQETECEWSRLEDIPTPLDYLAVLESQQ